MSEAAEIKKKRPYRRRKSVESSAPIVSESAPAEAGSPEAGPRPLMMTGSELLQMRLAQAELRTALAEREAAKLRKLFVLAKIDPKGVVEKQEKVIAERDSSLKEAQQKFSMLRLRIGTRLGVDLESCGIDVETGEVVPRTA